MYVECIITLVQELIDRAITVGASDIHLEPHKDYLRIRFRIDGILYDQPFLSHDKALQAVSRIKVLASLDLAQTRIPQDGRLKFISCEREIDLRVSTFPCLYGQNIVIRILDRPDSAISLESLGFCHDMFERFTPLISKSSGFMLVTGPTGAGKSTTLYAVLSGLNSSDRHVITLEDPVEYHLDGVTQGHIHPEAGFTFEVGMRAMLRQDPDVIMVGEIRDRQTARIAIEAALTGHLVLSTLHTVDAAGALMRLLDMGVEPFLLNASLTGILAQRLCRRICSECMQARALTEVERAFLVKRAAYYCFNDDFTLDVVYEGKGCHACFGYGTKGRIGVFQLLVMTNALRSLLVTSPVFESIESQAFDDGMKSLWRDGLEKVKRGIISLPDFPTETPPDTTQRQLHLD